MRKTDTTVHKRLSRVAARATLYISVPSQILGVSKVLGLVASDRFSLPGNHSFELWKFRGGEQDRCGGQAQSEVGGCWLAQGR